MTDGSISDIFFDEENQTIKNHKQEVIAYWDGLTWHCKVDELNDTYCGEINQLIKGKLEGASLEDPQSLIIQLKRSISATNRLKIKKNFPVKDAAIALDLNVEELKPVQGKLSKVFRKHKVKYSRIKNLHVSTAYLMGHNHFADLAELMDTISNYSYEFRVVGLEVLSGATTKNDYVVLKLEAPDNFYKALNKIEEESDVLKFPGGFKTHISLYSVPQNALTPDVIQELNSLLQNSEFKLNHQVVIKPHSVSVFNSSRLLEMRQKIRSAK